MCQLKRLNWEWKDLFHSLAPLMEKNKGFMCVMSSGSASPDSQKIWSDVLWGAGRDPEEDEHISTWPHTDHQRKYTRHLFKSSTWECDSFSTPSHPLTSEYNVHAWLDNCFLMLKYNIILELLTDIISEPLWNYLASLVDFTNCSILHYFYYLLLW